MPTAGASSLLPEVSPALKARDCKGLSSDATGDGAPLIPVRTGGGFDVANTLQKHHGNPQLDKTLVPIAWSEELTVSVDCAGTIQYGGQGGRHDGVAYSFSGQMSVPQVDRDLMQTLGAKNPMAVAFPINTQIAMRHEAMGESTGMGIGTENDPAFTLQSAHSHAVAFDLAQITSKTNRTRVEEGLPASTLNAARQMHTATVSPSLTAYNMDSRSPQSEEQQRIVGAVYKAAMQVRRLTPRECERLQGFPDDYTLVQHRNKPAADGPRYKALGNSMAVPVMSWIGRRIAMVEQLKGDSRDD